eukprot:gene56989-biopygen49909
MSPARGVAAAAVPLLFAAIHAGAQPTSSPITWDEGCDKFGYYPRAAYESFAECDAHACASRCGNDVGCTHWSYNNLNQCQQGACDLKNGIADEGSFVTQAAATATHCSQVHAPTAAPYTPGSPSMAPVLSPTVAPTTSGCADGTTDWIFSVFAVGCDGQWDSAGISNGAILCANGWSICGTGSEVAAAGVSTADCDCPVGMASGMFYATLQSSMGDWLCSSSGSNDVWGCGCNGPNPGHSCGVLASDRPNFFTHSSSDSPNFLTNGLHRSPTAIQRRRMGIVANTACCVCGGGQPSRCEVFDSWRKQWLGSQVEIGLGDWSHCLSLCEFEASCRQVATATLLVVELLRIKVRNAATMPPVPPCRHFAANCRHAAKQCRHAASRAATMPPCRHALPPCRQSAARATACRQDKARQGKARQGKARQGKARQGKARQGKARQGKARQGKARQGKARQG